jgi:hypothetical protein
MRGGPTHDISFPGDGWFVVGVLVLIVLIFIRMYAWGDQSGRRTAHGYKRRNAHRAGRLPERGGDHGHRTASRRRPNRAPRSLTTKPDHNGIRKRETTTDWGNSHSPGERQ